jgi:raffinose/stachyose/melibiose transport system substrate-binding protein
MKKLLALTLAALMCLPALSGCKGGTANSGKVTTIKFATSWVGTSTAKDWWNERHTAFNKAYDGKIKLEVEEIPGDQNYVDKMKVLYSSNSLPDVIATGGYDLISTMKDKFVDLTSYVDADSTWKSRLSAEGVAANSRNGKLYGIPYVKQVIGYFYNKDLFKKAGITSTATTWDELFAQADKLKAAGITPFSMDTADSGWVTSLMLCAMVAQDDTGEKFMNTTQPTDYNFTEFVSAAANIQKMFQKYTTSDAIGGKYENAASNFFSGKTAIIANGPWMIQNFYDSSMVPTGFADKVGEAAYPGNVMYNSGKIGFNIASKTKANTDAAVTFVKFLTSDESQQKCLETQGEIPDCSKVTSTKVKPLVTETIKLGASAKRKINDFQSLWYANVVDEVSVEYPLLAQSKITPTQFAAALTATAQKNK